MEDKPKPKLQRRVAINDSPIVYMSCSSPLLSPTSPTNLSLSADAISPTGKYAPTRAARGLKREDAMRQLPIRLIEQMGAPSPRRGLIRRADTVSVFEWFNSMGLADEGDNVCENSNGADEKQKRIVEKPLEEDESISVFLDAWNQLDAHDENEKQQAEIMQDNVEQVALEALKEQIAIIARSSPTPTPASPPETSETVASPPETVASPPETPVAGTATAETVVAQVESTEPAPPTTPSPSESQEKSATEDANKLVTKEPSLSDIPPDRAAAENEYRGPHLEGPITIEFLESLIQYFATSGLNAKLPIEYATSIVSQTLALLQTEPIILDIPIPSSGRVIVCGDTHGQFPDLITIIKDTGFPSEKQTIIFNGDFVDRGPAGIEVLLTLFTLKLLFPTYFYLHRGNHEQDHVNKTYNFEQQMLQKYNADLYNLIQDTFGQLPLGCVLAEKVFIVHGGLPEDTTLTIADFRKLPKVRDLPVGKGKTPQEKIIEDLLWADPRDRRGVRMSKRGAGVEFGPDITARFILRNHLELIVRSHELVSEGFQLSHNNQLMTVFSASYYCSSNTNKGAFVIFQDGADLKAPSVVQFYSQAFSAKDNVLKSCVKETLEKLRERIHTNRHALLLEFAKVDKELTGAVTPADWCAAMATALEIQIEWSGMLPYLSKLEEDGNILYIKYLNRYNTTKPSDDEKEEKIKKRKQKRVVRDICMKLHTLGDSFDIAFSSMDRNNDGFLDYLEFHTAFSSFELGLTNDQICDLMCKMDEEKRGYINLKQFTGFFKNQFERVKVISGALWISDAIVAAGNALSKEFDFLSTHKGRLKSGFRKVPKDDDGKITHELFAKWLVRTLHMDSYSLEDRMKMSMYVDFNNNGKISWREFKVAFMALDGKDPITEDILLHMCDVVPKCKPQLLRAFECMDGEGKGVADVVAFKAGLTGLNVMLDNPLSEVQIKKLHKAFDKEGTGVVNYKEFVDTFSVKNIAKMKAISEEAK